MLSSLSSFAGQRECFSVIFYFKKYSEKNIKPVKGLRLPDFPKLPVVPHPLFFKGLLKLMQGMRSQVHCWRTWQFSKSGNACIGPWGRKQEVATCDSLTQSVLPFRDPQHMMRNRLLGWFVTFKCEVLYCLKGPLHARSCVTETFEWESPVSVTQERPELKMQIRESLALLGRWGGEGRGGNWSE